MIENLQLGNYTQKRQARHHHLEPLSFPSSRSLILSVKESLFLTIPLFFYYSFLSRIPSPDFSRKYYPKPKNFQATQCTMPKDILPPPPPPTPTTSSPPLRPPPPTPRTQIHHEMHATEAASYEQDHVHDVYEAIAQHFSSTRYKVSEEALFSVF